MPNLRRIPRTVRRRPRVSQRQVVARTEPQVAELEFGGLRWLNIEEPTAVETAYLAEHFDFHELDLEDVLSTRQRPKIDEYDDYLFMVLHLPRFDKSIGRLNAAELNVFVGPDYVITLPNHPLKPVGRLFSRLSNNTELREEYFSKGVGLPAVRDPVGVVRLLLPDPGQDRVQARPPAERDLGASAARTWPATSPT